MAFIRLQAQQFLTFDSIPWRPDGSYDRTFHTMVLESCSPVDSLGPFGLTAQASAQLENGRIIYYGLSIGPGGLPDGIYSINPPFASSFYHGEFAQVRNVEAMACDYNGLVYVVGDGVGTYDYDVNAFTDLGSLPPGMRAGGGLAYREGRFYLTTANNELAEIDIGNPANSTILASFPPEIPLIRALFTYPYRCDSIITYAIGADSGESILYRLDFEDYSLTELCPLERFHLSASTANECVLPPCEIYVDLDKDDSSGAPETGFRRVTCAGPVQVSAPDVEVFSPFPLDSIRLQLIGVLDAGAEYLSAPGSGEVAVQGNNSANLLLVNQGGARAADLEEAIRNSLYHNDAAVPTLGPREVIVSMYSSFYGSVPSIATIIIDSTVVMSLAADVTDESCAGNQDGGASLTATGGAEPYSFLWADGQLLQQRAGLAAGEYAVTITDNLGCRDADTLSIGRVDSLIVAVSSNTDHACGDNATLFAAAQGGTAPYTFSWNSGPLGDTLAGVGAGTYQLLATDARGCTASAALDLAGADTVLTNQDVQLCQGEAFEWQGGSYFSDTTLCQVYTSALGCDSTHCFSLRFLAPEYAEFQQSVCRGGRLTWEGLFLEPDADTTVCVAYTAVTGCDSTLCLQVEVLNREGTLEAAICQGETYPFNGQLLSEPGLYLDTLAASDGCDSLLTLRLEDYPLPEPAILASGSLCTGATVELSSSLEGEYLWSTGAAGRSVTVSRAGVYSLTFTDARGCSADAVISLAENNLQAAFTLLHPRCAGESSGKVVIDSITGGVGPYFIGLEEGALQAASSIEGLRGGGYTLIVEDAEGCRKQYEFSLQQPDPLILSLPADTTLKLGDSLLLRPSVNAGGWSVRWRPPDFLSCDTCLAPVARPLQTTAYQALFTDSLGCKAEAEITVFVRRESGIYVPNAFSPNEDGRNDRLIPYADASIELIESYRIYSRWGALLFERTNFRPNDESLGWDGKVNGQPAPPGPYVYQLIAERLDGRTAALGGEVMLMR